MAPKELTSLYIRFRVLLSGRYTPLGGGGRLPASQLFQPSLPPPQGGCTRMGSSLPPAEGRGKFFEGVFLCTMRFSFTAQPSGRPSPPRFSTPRPAPPPPPRRGGVRKQSSAPFVLERTGTSHCDFLCCRQVAPAAASRTSALASWLRST
jgi:hypothetical protein